MRSLRRCEGVLAGKTVPSDCKVSALLVSAMPESFRVLLIGASSIDSVWASAPSCPVLLDGSTWEILDMVDRDQLILEKASFMYKLDTGP